MIIQTTSLGNPEKRIPAGKNPPIIVDLEDSNLEDVLDRSLQPSLRPKITFT